MVKVKMGFLKLSVPEQIERARLIATGVTGNPAFPVPDPSMADFNISIDALEVAYNASRTDSVQMAIMRLRRKEMLAMVRRLAAYVQATSAGNEEIILSSGFDVVRRGAPLGPVGQVLNLRVKAGGAPGSLRLVWNTVVGAGAYQVQISETNLPDSFELVRIAIATRADVNGLVPGKVYYVRVGAVGREEYGAWSAVVTANAKI